ncbi:MAG: hypothetical protein LBG08_06910 [Spirochaetaceae bacterium]|nr:hypothetical protein [Spirochaetaceae bacterium]
MVKHINFEGNILLLAIRIRMIRDMLSLDVDPDLFLEMTMDDADFIDRTLEILLGNLLENRWLIERDEQLYNLSKTECQFGEVLSELAAGSGNISGVKIPVIYEKVSVLQKQSLARRKSIDESMTESGKTSDDMVVGSDELMELFKDFK